MMFANRDSAENSYCASRSRSRFQQQQQNQPPMPRRLFVCCVGASLFLSPTLLLSRSWTQDAVGVRGSEVSVGLVCEQRLSCVCVCVHVCVLLLPMFGGSGASRSMLNSSRRHVTVMLIMMMMMPCMYVLCCVAWMLGFCTKGRGGCACMRVCMRCVLSV